MTFTFTNYAAIKPRHSPLNDIIGKALSGYNEVTKSKYLKPGLEADIFHKQISPLAMLASSPYFSSLHPQQQQQIAGYISQMLSKQGMSGMGGEGSGQMPGMPGQGNMGGIGGNQSMGNQQMNGGQQEGYDQDGNSLVPGNPGEHFTGKFTESPYGAGTAHRGQGGETIYAPTGSNVQKGIDVLTESKGLKKIFDEYSKVAPKVGGAGGFKRDLSNVASGIAKTDLPFSDKISQFLGGSTLSNEAASAEAYKAQMAPALRAIGFSNPEINSLLKFYPGETEKNIQDRLDKTWPIIEKKIKTHQKNLNKGINVNQNVIGENDVPRSIDQKIARDEQERAQAGNGSFKEAPAGTIGLYRKGELYYIPADKVNAALAKGFNYE
jgi:hypothetical protein